MTDRILIEAANNNGFRDGGYTRRGYFIAVSIGSGYDGGGYGRHDGEWIIMSDVDTGAIFKEPMYRCKEVRPTPSKEQP